MLKRLLIVFCLALLPAPAIAQDMTPRDRVISVLRDDGFSEVRISRTLLGRMRFVAENSDRRREIIMNPASGVILRDYVRFKDVSGSSSGSSGGGAISGGQDDDFDFDDDDDDDDHDYETDDDDRDDDSGGSDDDSDDNSNSGSDDGGSDSGGSDDGDDDDD